MRRARPLPALVIPPRLTLSPVELSEGTRPRYPDQLTRILKAGEITDLGQYRHGGNEIDPAHRLQGRDDLGKRPFGYRLADRLLQALHALAFLADALKKLFENHTLLAILELLRHQPLHVGRSPRRLARSNSVPAAASATKSAGACPADPSSPPDGHGRGRAWLRAARRAPTQQCSSPARDSLARLTASRRFVFTRSPGFFGVSEGATTMHSWPRLLISR